MAGVIREKVQRGGKSLNNRLETSSGLWDPGEVARDKRKSSGELGSYMCQEFD